MGYFSITKHHYYSYVIITYEKLHNFESIDVK